jgi:hypothetical protein
LSPKRTLFGTRGCFERALALDPGNVEALFDARAKACSTVLPWGGGRLRRPALLIAVRFRPAPPSRDRVHDHSVRVGPWTVAVARPAIRGCGRYRGRSGDRSPGRSGDWRSRFNRGSGLVSWGRSPDIGASGNSNRSTSCYRAAVFAPMDPAANPSNAHGRKRPSKPGLSPVKRE